MRTGSFKTLNQAPARFVCLSESRPNPEAGHERGMGVVTSIWGGGLISILTKQKILIIEALHQTLPIKKELQIDNIVLEITGILTIRTNVT